MKRSYFLLLIAVLSLALSFTSNGFQHPTQVLAQSPALPRWNEANSAQLDKFVTETTKRLGIPGTAIGIIQNGQVVYTRGFGVRRVGSTEPVTPDTLFMIGSTTKAMTTMMMATVVDDGIIRWDTKAHDIVPQFALSDPGRAETLTVRQLVCNCSGVPQHDPEMIFFGDSISVPDMVHQLSQFPIVAPVGKEFHYSNQMVALGGYTAAIAATYGSLDTAHDAYALQMKQRVWGPIGMSHTTLSFEDATATGNAASPHSFDLSGKYVPFPLQVERGVIPAAPAGGAWSSVNDMTRYLITQAQQGVAPDGRRVVSAANLTATWQPQIQVTAGVDYALGWLVGKFGDIRVITHDGGTNGFSSRVMIFPDLGFGFVFLTNAAADTPYMSAIQNTIFNIMLGTKADVEQKVQQQLEEPPTLPAGLSDTVDQRTVAPYLGRYTTPRLGEVEVKADNGHLHVTSPALDITLYPHHTADGKVDAYYVFNPPLTGSTFILTTDPSGAPILKLHYPTADEPGGAMDVTFTRAK